MCESDISVLPTVQWWIMGDLLLYPYIIFKCESDISVSIYSTIMNHERSIFVPLRYLQVWKWYLRFYLQYNNESWEIYYCTPTSAPRVKVIYPFYLQYNDESWEIYYCTPISAPSVKVISPFYLQWSNESWEIYYCIPTSAPSVKVIYPLLSTVQYWITGNILLLTLL